jgi:hypothetical protein
MSLMVEGVVDGRREYSALSLPPCCLPCSAAAQFESLYAALTVFVGLNLLQFVIGS